MADVWTGQVGNNHCPQLHLEVHAESGQADRDILRWTLWYVAHGYALYTGNLKWADAKINGQAVYGANISVNGVTGTVQLGTGTYTIWKNHGWQNIPIYCGINFGSAKWNGATMGARTASGTVGVAARTSYTVSYNANGGSGAPGNQTKWHGENLTLSGTRPTRTGHNFAGWATSASGGVAYQPGGTYTGNSNLTLYAKWTAHTYAVKYNANGGTGAPGQQTKTYGQTLKLSSTKPTRTNYNFRGWGTSASSTTVAYAPGANYTANAAITLYAIWQLAYTRPRITGLTADRCNSAGTLAEDGQYAKVAFRWATDRSVSSISVAGSSVSASGTSGSVTKVVGGSYSTETSYDISVSVADSGGTTTLSTTLAPMKYIIDFASGGAGLAIGRPATGGEYFDVGLPMNAYDAVTFRKRISGLQWQGLCGSSNRYLLLAQSVYDIESKNESGHIRIHGSIGTYEASGRGYFDVFIPLRNLETNGKSQIHVITRSSKIRYDIANIEVYIDSGNILRVYLVVYANRWYYAHIFLEGTNFTVPDNIQSVDAASSLWVSSPVGTAFWRLSTAALSMFPVGTVLIRYDHTSPASLYGGTWSRIEGRFLFATGASGTIGETGGSATHTLTTAQMPSHAHVLHGHTWNWGAQSGSGTKLGVADTGNVYQGAPFASNGLATIQGTYNATMATGSGGSHNNNPAFIKVAVWRRTA